jgi:hypothetical protein
MADKKESGFEEKREDISAKEDRFVPPLGEENLQEEPGTPVTGMKRNPLPTLLLLVLMLVVFAAGLYYYTGTFQPTMQQALSAVVERQPIAVPPNPAIIENFSAVAQSEPAWEQKVDEEVVEEKVAASEAFLAVPTKKYTLQAGAYLLKSNLLEAEKKVRRLGFEPRIKSVRKTMEMKRLRIGSFSPLEGKAKMKELKAMAPDAFYVRQGEQLVVYAGSYYHHYNAHKFADRLYQHGILADEERAQVGVPLMLLSFGDFPDEASAAEVAAKARAAGLEVYAAMKDCG